jgi:hypothetical protein
MMETRAFEKDIEEEDPTMVAYIPDLRRLNELGMITFNSQSGKRQAFPHYQTGKRVVLGERAYCYGFVDASVADAVIKRMWETDKYVARCIDVDAVSRGYDALSDYGRIGVTRTECEGVVNWHTRASPVVEPHDYACNYGRFVYPEHRGNPADADGEKAIRHVGPYKEHPVPRTAVCLLCVDMRLGRLADARDGLFTQLEAALRSLRGRPTADTGVRAGILKLARPASAGQQRSQKSRASRKSQKARKARTSQKSRKSRKSQKAQKARKKRRYTSSGW